MTTYRVFSDLLYRSVTTVDTSNSITEAYDTDAYGNTLCYSGPGTDGDWFTDDDVQTDSPVNCTIFTGRQYDPESQIYYYRARYFAPNIGRFPSRDPLKEFELIQGPNGYWYVQNNPILIKDPSGLKCHCGPDVTSAVSATLKAMANAFRNASNKVQTAACLQVFTFDLSAEGAWDIVDLANLGKKDIYPFARGTQGTGHCKLTVAYQGECVYARSLNYLLYGLAVSLCKESLSKAEAFVWAQKVGVYADFGETNLEARDFTSKGGRSGAW